MSRAAQPAIGPRRPTEDLTHRFEAVRGHLRGKLDREIDDDEVFEELFEAFWAQEPTPDPDPEATTLTEIAQNDSDGSQSDAGLETAQDTPDCHHEPVWYESGTCMACEPAGRGSEERNVERELTRDAAGGILP